MGNLLINTYIYQDLVVKKKEKALSNKEHGSQYRCHMRSYCSKFTVVKLMTGFSPWLPVSRLHPPTLVPHILPPPEAHN